jgi:hypothetical protein
MQCVERGLVKLDDDITTWLPEWKEAVILKGFDGENKDKPILKRAQNPILLKFTNSLAIRHAANRCLGISSRTPVALQVSKVRRL